jgi:ankyrin repeat protein
MHADQPIPLLYSGQAGQYFGTEYEGLPSDVVEAVKALDEQLRNRSLKYFGKLTCSQFQFVDIYAYGSLDQRIAVSIMVGEDGLQGIDCVSKFADGSFLTTTTVKVLPDAYEEQKLFRVSFPGLTAVELLAQHLLGVADFEVRYGEVNAQFDNLMAIAQSVDEYTLRQQDTFGHGMLQFLSGFASGGMMRTMGSEDEEDDDDCERIEYDEAEETPIVQAILRNDLALVKKLLTEGADLNPTDWDEDPPLVAAVYRGNLEMIQCLIAAGADVNRIGLNVDARPISMAIKQHRPDLVKMLLDAGASPEGGDMSYTGLVVAIGANSPPIVKILLEAGANPNAEMEDDYRAIMHAARKGNLEIVKLLVEYGADVNAWSQGDTAIMIAAYAAHQEIYDYLYPLLDEEVRAYADEDGQKEIAKAIKRKTREANKINEKLGDLALYGKTNRVKQLLAEGADPNAITKNGKTPLIYAAMYGHKATITELLNAGADPNLGGEQEYEEGQTALMQIASSFFIDNRAALIKFLIDRGADPNIQDAQGQTALMIAGENADAVKALLDCGADPDLRDKDGNTAMMLGNWAVQQLLRQAGASAVGLND